VLTSLGLPLTSLRGLKKEESPTKPGRSCSHGGDLRRKWLIIDELTFGKAEVRALSDAVWTEDATKRQASYPEIDLDVTGRWNHGQGSRARNVVENR
jgi:hypothetical protein